MEIGIRFEGIEKLEAKLMEKSATDFDEVAKKNLREIYARGQTAYKNGAVPATGGTPYDTGQLRISLGYRGTDLETGYNKEYGPHVEYGHRTNDGGFVPGQYFLKANVETQKPIYKQDLIAKLKE